MSLGIGRKTLSKDAVPIIKPVDSPVSVRKPPLRRSRKKICAENFDNNETISTVLTEVEELQNQIEQLKKDKISLQN